MTKEKIKEEAEKQLLFRIIALIGVVLFLGIFITNVKADTITFQ